VSKAFKGVQALAGADLEARRGEILGLIGPNGSGKSTLINVVSGHYRADAGSIVYEGAELRDASPHRIARAGIARTYQIPRPFAHLSVLENVALPPMFGQVAMDRRAAEAEAWRWLAFTGLEKKALQLPRELNLHERKFLELARALASRPKLLFLDEVLSGLTPAEIDEAIRLVRAIREQGATIVLVEHVMRAVMELTDRVVVLTGGRTIANGAPREVMRDPQVVDAYLGTAHA
jgi:branched-chain amino acid transport system permease protein